MLKVKETATQLIITGPDSELEAAGECFKFRPPGYFYAVSFQQHRVSEGTSGWDGYINPFRRIGPGTAVLPRGRKKDLFAVAKDLEITVDTRGLLENPFACLTVADVPADLIEADFKLDPRQCLCICNWLKAGIGINKISVGGGKTATYAGAAKLLKQRFPDARFLYLTPSERLVRQSVKEMRKMLPQFEVGQCGGGHRDFDAKDMVVCTAAMLNRHYRELLNNGFFETFICIMFDECHHAASATAVKLLSVTPAYYRLGASDSVKKDDLGKYFTIRGLLGPVLTEVESAPLIEEGRLAKPHIYVVNLEAHRGRFNDVPHRAQPGSKAYVLQDGRWTPGVYQGPVLERDKEGNLVTMLRPTAVFDDVLQQFIPEEVPVTISGLHRIELEGVEHEVESRWCLLDRAYDRAVIRFKSRNDLIVRWTQHFSQQGWPTVVVATRTTHVYILEELLKKAVPAHLVRVLTGYENDSPTQRDKMFEWFKSTEGAVLITPLIKEGVSINEIRAMVVADYVSDYEVARQILGRAMREKKTDNRAHVVWFWDRQNRSMSAGCEEMLRRLELTEGFTYYYPCLNPEDINWCKSSLKRKPPKQLSLL